MLRESADGYVKDLVTPLFRLRCRPYEKQPFDCFANGTRLIWNDKQAGRGLSGSEAFPEMRRHRIAVLRDQNSTLFGRDFEERRIFGPSQPGALHLHDVEGRFARTQTLDDAVPEILIRQEADGHVRFELSCSRAASRRANSSGFVSFNGRTLRSNSRSTSAKKSSIRFLFSR